MERTYLRFPLVLDITKQSDETIEQIIAVFEETLNGTYRFSKQAFLDVMSDLREESNRKFSFARTYICISDHQNGSNYIRVMDSVSDLGGVMVDFESLLKYRDNELLSKLLVK